MTTSRFRFLLMIGLIFAATPLWGAATDVRVPLHTQLVEHVHLTGSMTAAALAGRKAEMAAAVRALDANSIDLSRTIGDVYGADAERRFLTGWRRHVEFLVWYAKGVMTNDRSMRDKATTGLETYAEDLATFLHNANPHLSKSTIAALVREHSRALLRVIDAQAANDSTAAYAAIRAGSTHTHTIAGPIGEAIARQFPDRFGR